LNSILAEMAQFGRSAIAQPTSRSKPKSSSNGRDDPKRGEDRGGSDRKPQKSILRSPQCDPQLAEYLARLLAEKVHLDDYEQANEIGKLLVEISVRSSRR